MVVIVLSLTFVSLVIWLGLLAFRGQFWRLNEQLEGIDDTKLQKLPDVCVVIPARNEADLLPVTLRSLLVQDYPGNVSIFLVDDNSTDNTAVVAQTTAQNLGKQLHIISGKPLPNGWSGKLWAVEQGIQKASEFTPEYFFLTDADICHDVNNLRRLVTKAVQENLDLVSAMVQLRCESFWEKLLIPAFVFFFQKLYPFAWVNNPKNPTAAAAGGSILIRAQTLTQIGGMQILRQTLIDDCTLAHAVKSKGGHIWLGLSTLTHSLRPYTTLNSIWDMVARTAFTQLNYSLFLLLSTITAIVLVYILPVFSIILSIFTQNWLLGITGLSTWLLMTLAYLPTIMLYNCNVLYALSLPAIAFLYTLMTIDSALRYWQGRGGAWKGRVYPM